MTMTLEEARRINPEIHAIGRTSDHNHPFCITIACQRCGGPNVSRDASARWNYHTQLWELGCVQDQGYCEDCGAEARLVERFVSFLGNDLGPVTPEDRTVAELEAKKFSHVFAMAFEIESGAEDGTDLSISEIRQRIVEQATRISDAELAQLCSRCDSAAAEG